VIDLNYNVIQVNKQFCNITGLGREELIGHPCYTSFAGGDCRNSDDCRLQTILKKPEIYECISRKVAPNGGELYFRMTSAPMWSSKGEVSGIVEDLQDITPLVKAQEEKEQAQNRLHQAAKLESVGQLAAGIAHEINTPVQFVTTNFDFLQESFNDISSFISQVQESMRKEKIDGSLNQAMEELDWEFLSEEVPRAIEQSMEGMDRVRKLVLAMKAFSHPSTREMAPADINAILDNSIIISQNEWKHVADLKTEFSPDLPQVPCLTDEMGQVFLSILVNAGHAVADKVQGTHDKGYITVRTVVGDGVVEIIISDTGKGMDDELCGKIFDPFFTTKEVGRGTGQGLAIAYDIVVNKHHGEINVKSTPAVGTTFTILLPL
jgi:PAS domain S-box-containing protein